MRLLVVHAHPVPESFNTALCRAVLETARQQGHDVRLIDLHADGFNPVMTAEERRGYTEDVPVPPDLRPHVEALQWAEGLILVYPTWWYSQPAILKGWIDRVWRPGITFTLRTATEPLRGALHNVRLIGVITTFGSPWWFWTFLIGAPGRKIILRGLRYCTHPRTRTFWLGLHDMDARTDTTRARFLGKVRARIARIPL
ncbi:MAG: NAD(P)H-dependent oxidoreductase [Rhodobacter sp.]|nr:NAD(P)H-dependent oxidoreductase [Rhodobacter sp.]MCA3511698.1 NAD(P)H-dependent oxidoreductase [Rhodobacter sp.]MCA3520516.1 NAD(P)H-dependent oxidoreductase [Rhodobacter sp.]MCA3523031.1 NAD(P)H-dependent oxidoreductase [Rhodobacter sp.]MCA3526751.1 NAD(P)H-dependent oxidoreductase [Rhodobacter sp.]